jgi:hypothetical protein
VSTLGCCLGCGHGTLRLQLLLLLPPSPLLWLVPLALAVGTEAAFHGPLHPRRLVSGGDCCQISATIICKVAALEMESPQWKQLAQGQPPILPGVPLLLLHGPQLDLIVSAFADGVPLGAALLSNSPFLWPCPP